MSRFERALLVGQPMLFGAAVVLARFVTNATTPESLVRPVIVVVAVSGVILLVVRVLLRDWVLAALASSAFVLLSLREPLPGAVLAAVTAWWLLIKVARRASGRTLPPRTALIAVGRASGIFSLAFLAAMGFSAWSAATSGSIGAAETDELPAPAGRGGPNVYVLLLDGYPRADTLAETFGIDNTPFLRSLESMGFSVSPEARSNYTNTWLTLASALNGRYVEDLLDERSVPGAEATQIRWLHSLIDHADAVRPLRDAGYSIRTVASPFGSTTLTSADAVVNEGRLTGFEVALISTSPWTALFGEQVGGALLEAHRDTTVTALEHLSDLAEGVDAAPQFVFTHVESPHPPFALQWGNGPADVQDCFPVLCSLWAPATEQLGISFDEYRALLARELTVLNGLVIQAVQRVVNADPEAVVVVFSDHGIRYSYDDRGEHLEILFAARTPGATGLYPADAHPVNLLRVFLAEYLDMELPPLPYQGWQADQVYPLRLTPVGESGEGPKRHTGRNRTPLG